MRSLPDPEGRVRGTHRNIPLFIAFRVFFNARFYYPVLGILFIDLGLTLAQYALLNVIWAATIVTLEVPSGALADALGRRTMVVLAAGLMVAEMAVFAFAPTGNTMLLFWLLALNRVLSGAAEACASGADEALAYDSLPADTREQSWPKVLASLLRWQSAGFFIAMLLGAALFDRDFLDTISAWVGILHPPESVTRWPVYATLATSVVCLAIALSMHETEETARHKSRAKEAVQNIFRAGKFIATDSRILLLLFAGLVCDSFIRLFLTFASNYNRLVELPEALFGVIASAMALLGFVAAPIGKALVTRNGATANFLWLGALILLGLCFVAAALPYWGALAAVPLGIAMSLLGFLLSNYLNAWATPDLRATILSFRGLAFNLGYGTIGLAFATLTTILADRSPTKSENSLFAESLLWLPPAFLASALAILLVASLLKKNSKKT